MKTKILIPAALLTMGMAFTGCSDDFLEVTNPTQLTLDEYFNNEENVFASLVAAYDPLHWHDYNGAQYTSLNVVADVMSDQMYKGGGNAADCEYLYLAENFNQTPDNCISGLWTTFYSGIKRVNDCFGYIENIPETSNTKRWKSELYTLRAYYYSLLWKFWGNIPYYDQNLKYPYTTKQLSDNWEEGSKLVYEKIIADLEKAISNGNLPIKAEKGEEGRVTRAFTYMIYADVVLYQKDESRYSTAVKYMDAVIENYPLMENYSDIWKTEGEWCQESVFEINYNPVNGRTWSPAIEAAGANFPAFSAPNGFNGPAEICDNTGWGFCPLYPQVADELFEAGDTRKEATVLDIRDEKYSGKYTARFQNTGLFLNKYVPLATNRPATGDAALSYGNNYRVFRSAEAYLNAAELVAKGATGAKSSAKEYVNAVQTRANAEITDGSIREIVEEAAKEFVGEGKRYFILVRNDMAAEKIVADEPNNRTSGYRAEHKYWPIPATEIKADPELIQNPGY